MAGHEEGFSNQEIRNPVSRKEMLPAFLL